MNSRPFNSQRRSFDQSGADSTPQFVDLVRVRRWWEATGEEDEKEWVEGPRKGEWRRERTGWREGQGREGADSQSVSRSPLDSPLVSDAHPQHLTGGELVSPPALLSSQLRSVVHTNVVVQNMS